MEQAVRVPRNEMNQTMQRTLHVRIFDVVPTDTGLWAVVADGVGVTINPAKADAAQIARDMAKTNRPSRLVIRTERGEIESITPFAVSIRVVNAI
jgi:hypothetical protein